MLLIEKLKLDPLADVLFNEFVSKICCPKVVHPKGDTSRISEDLFVQTWVEVEITGVKDASAEWVQTEGKVT